MGHGLAASEFRVTPGRSPTEVTPLLQIDDGRLLNQLPVWAPDPMIRKKILVDNPVRLRVQLITNGGVTTMRYLKPSVVMTVASVLALTLRLHGQAPQQESLVWAPVPSTPNTWTAPQQAPHQVGRPARGT